METLECLGCKRSQILEFAYQAVRSSVLVEHYMCLDAGHSFIQLIQLWEQQTASMRGRCAQMQRSCLESSNHQQLGSANEVRGDR
jgi:hypothetical protein